MTQFWAKIETPKVAQKGNKRPHPVPLFGVQLTGGNLLSLTLRVDDWVTVWPDWAIFFPFGLL